MVVGALSFPPTKRNSTLRSCVRVLLTFVCLLGTVRFTNAGNDIITVEIFDKPAMFRPDHPKIKVGQTIKWVNKGETVHTVTADPSQAPDPSWVSVPPGSEELDSGYMSPGDSFSYQFKVPGTYKYFCLTHEQEGMRAQVEVEK
jgi:plastocyanin